MMEAEVERCGHKPRKTGGLEEQQQARNGFSAEPPGGSSPADTLDLIP